MYVCVSHSYREPQLSQAIYIYITHILWNTQSLATVEVLGRSAVEGNIPLQAPRGAVMYVCVTRTYMLRPN